MRIGAASRAPAITDFLRSIASQWDGNEHVKRVLLHVCDPRHYMQEPEKAAAVRDARVPGRDPRHIDLRPSDGT